jgi:hypothetical protein
MAIESKTEEKFEVIIDQDDSLGYEKKRWPYLLSLPLMWLLTIWVFLKKGVLGIKPRINTFWVDGLSLPCREIKEGAASWRALDIIYNFEFGQQDGIHGKVSDYWIGIMNAQGVRNRLKLVKRELAAAIREISQNTNEVRLLSIASGSAQSIIEVMAELNDIDIKTTLLDLDPSAVDYSRKLAKKYGIEDKITFCNGSTSGLEKVMGDKRPHIIEMVGFLDYRPHAKAVSLVKRIYEFLLPGGIFLTANARSNPEQHFLRWVVDWPMIYRRPEELGSIIEEGGFAPENCKIIYEPLKIHGLAIAQKLPAPNEV